VLRRFPDSIPDDSILLSIFAGEREDSIEKSKNRFRIGYDSFAEIGEKQLKTSIFWFCLTKNFSQIDVDALCRQQIMFQFSLNA
jgi:hypothetical protein